MGIDSMRGGSIVRNAIPHMVQLGACCRGLLSLSGGWGPVFSHNVEIGSFGPDGRCVVKNGIASASLLPRFGTTRKPTSIRLPGRVRGQVRTSFKPGAVYMRS